MKKYYIWGKCFLGAGYLSIQKDGKRHWGSYDSLQLFSEDEIDNILDTIGSEWTWEAKNIETRELYRKHEAQYVYI